MHVRLRRVARLIFGFTCVCAVIYYLSTSHNHGDSATRRHPPARPGTCTLLINVFSRPETVRDTLQHYAGSSVIDHIVVIWASPVPTGDLAELLPAEDGRPPISFVYPPSSSLNYRFYPWPEIQNDCVMHMDDGQFCPPLGRARFFLSLTSLTLQTGECHLIMSSESYKYGTRRVTAGYGLDSSTWVGATSTDLLRRRRQSSQTLFYPSTLQPFGRNTLRTPPSCHLRLFTRSYCRLAVPCRSRTCVTTRRRRLSPLLAPSSTS